MRFNFVLIYIKPLILTENLLIRVEATKLAWDNWVVDYNYYIIIPRLMSVFLFRGENTNEYLLYINVFST